MSTVVASNLSQRRAAVRGWPDIALLIVGAALFATAAALIHRHHVDGAETAVFRAINDHTIVPGFVVWPVMQLGNFLVGRPATLLDDVHLRNAPAHGLGFVSGHVAVISALVVIAWPYLSRRWRTITVLVAVLVALARVHVGAHLPLDVVGGAGLGIAVAGLVRLALGRPTGAAPKRAGRWHHD